jgi:hypothetical protein
MNWYKTALKDGEDYPAPEDLKAAFIQRMQELGLTEEEIERAIKSGYLKRMMSPPEKRKKS